VLVDDTTTTTTTTTKTTTTMLVDDTTTTKTTTAAWQKVLGQSVSGGLFPWDHRFEYNTGSSLYISKTVMENYK
jgi:hypothetical protein